MVVNSRYQGVGQISAGAVTWCEGTVGRSGLVTAENSLLGKSLDEIGDAGVLALARPCLSAVAMARMP